MSAVFEGKPSDSPYIHRVWRGHVEEDYVPVCPADTHWNLLILKRGREIKVAAEGALAGSILKREHEGSEFVVIQSTQNDCVGTAYWLSACEKSVTAQQLRSRQVEPQSEQS